MLAINSGPWYHAVVMAKEFLNRIDISDVPALVKLAEEVRSSNRSAVLICGSEELAMLTPRRMHGAPHVPTLADPDDIWAGYDPEHVKQALVDSAGIFRDLDRDAFLVDLEEQGQQDGQ